MIPPSIHQSRLATPIGKSNVRKSMFDVVSRQVITNIQDTDQENIMDIAHIGTCMVAHVQLTHIVLVKGHCYRRSSKLSTESQCEVQMIFLAV